MEDVRPHQGCLRGVSESRNRSARAEPKKPALLSLFPSLPSLPRERTRHRLCLAFSYFSPPFPLPFYFFFIFPPSPPFTISPRRRFPWAGAEPVSPPASPRPPPPYGEREPPPHPGTSGGGWRSGTGGGGGGGLRSGGVMELIR